MFFSPVNRPVVPGGQPDPDKSKTFMFMWLFLFLITLFGQARFTPIRFAEYQFGGRKLSL